MATDEQALGWLAATLDWEQDLRRLRRAAAMSGVVTPAAAPAPASPPLRDDRRDPDGAHRFATPRAQPATEDRGADARPRRVEADDGVPTSA